MRVCKSPASPISTTNTRPVVVSTDFHEFPDKTLIELIANSRAPSGLSFVILRNGRLDMTETYVHGGEVYVPALPNSHWARLVQLPHGFGSQLSYQHLFGRIAALIKMFIDVDNISLAQLAAFVLATWLPGHGSTAPFVLVVGPAGSGKTTLLKLLSCLCRRSLLVAGPKPLEIYDMALSVRPTLLLDEVELDKDLRRLIRVSHTADIVTCYKSRPLDVFGPKVITCREIPDDEAFISRCVQVTLIPTSKSLATLTGPMMEKIRTIQLPRMLTYRLMNFYKREHTQIMLDELAPRTRDMANSLIAVPRQGLCASLIVAGLRQQDEDRLVDRGISEHGLLVEQLFALCHSGAWAVLVGGFTSLMNVRMQELKQPKRYNPKEIGVKLRTMGLFSTRTRSGWAVPLWADNQQTIHRLAKIHGLSITDSARAATCAWCSRTVPEGSAEQSYANQPSGPELRTRKCKSKRR